MAENSIRARIKLPNLPAFSMDIPMRSGHEAFGFLAMFIAHCEGVECPVRQAYRVMAMDDAAVTLTNRSVTDRSAQPGFSDRRKA